MTQSTPTEHTSVKDFRAEMEAIGDTIRYFISDWCEYGAGVVAEELIKIAFPPDICLNRLAEALFSRNREDLHGAVRDIVLLNVMQPKE